MSAAKVFLIILLYVNTIKGAFDLEVMKDVAPLWFDDMIIGSMDEALICLGKTPPILQTKKFMDIADTKKWYNILVHRIRQTKLRELAYALHDGHIVIPSNVTISLTFIDIRATEYHFWWFYVALIDCPFHFMSIFSPTFDVNNYTIEITKYIFGYVLSSPDLHHGTDIYLTFKAKMKAYQLNIIVDANILFPLILNRHAMNNDPWDSIYIKFRDYGNEGIFLNSMKEWKLSEKSDVTINGLSCTIQYPCNFNFISKIKNRFIVHIGAERDDPQHIIDISDVQFGGITGKMRTFVITEWTHDDDHNVHLIIPKKGINHIGNIELPLHTYLYHDILQWNTYLGVSSLAKEFELMEINPVLMDFRNLYFRSSVMVIPKTGDMELIIIDLRGMQFPANVSKMIMNLHADTQAIKVIVDQVYQRKFYTLLGRKKVLEFYKEKYSIQIFLPSFSKSNVKIYNKIESNVVIQRNEHNSLGKLSLLLSLDKL